MAHESSIYIITASLTKDMNSKVDLFRMNALRLTPIIIEPQYLIQSERYIKQVMFDIQHLNGLRPSLIRTLLSHALLLWQVSTSTLKMPNLSRNGLMKFKRN